ncbi:MAG: methyltransferase [Methanosphaera sp.]|nr:methyltransferase [Methanosphaera sp.]
MSSKNYWTKIREIAIKLNKIGKEHIDETSLNELIPILNEIEVIAHDEEINYDSAKLILSDEGMINSLETIREFYIYIGARLERENAYEIIEGGENAWDVLDTFHFYERYEGLLKNESQLVPFDENTKFIFIGSGPLPLTLIMFNKIFGCKCVGIEVQPSVAKLSRHIIRRLGLEDDIKIVIGDERYIKHLDYDVIMVAAFAIPKNKVFSNLWEIVDEDTPILYRTYSGMRQMLYEPVKDVDLRGFHQEGLVLPTGNVNNTSVLIKKIT